MGVPLYVTNCFSLAPFNILSLSVTFDMLIKMCLVGGWSLKDHLIWNSLNFLDLNVLTQVTEVFSHYFFK